MADAQTDIEVGAAEALPREARPLSDLGNAQRLVDHHGADLHHVHGWGRWLEWDGVRWCSDETGGIERRAKQTIRAMLPEAQDLPDKESNALVKHQLATQAAPRIRAMIELARSEPGIPVQPADLDSAPMLLTAQNGTVDLSTGELRPHQRCHLATKLAPVDYDPAATAPTWMAFLERIFAGDQELIDYMGRVAGYSLTGDTSEQVFFMLYGTGGNGKTVMIKTVQRVMGDYARQADFSTFLERGRDTPTNDVARLAGARMVAALEAADRSRLDEARVKQVTGGDTVTARHLYQEAFEYRPAFKLWLATNHRPVIRGTDEAMWRRVHLIPFEVTIPPAERDRHLADRLEAEAAGILAWAVRGCLDWLQAGLRPPARVLAASQGYRADMDVLGAFLDECCLLGENLRVGTSALFEEYKAWAERSGEHPLSQRALAQQLDERGFVSGRAHTGRFWQGFGLLARDAVTHQSAVSGTSHDTHTWEKSRGTRHEASRVTAGTQVEAFEA